MFFNKEISCKNCGNKVLCEVNPETHLLIDVEHAYHSTLLAKMRFLNSPKHVTLSEVPTNLHIQNEKYQLIGLISYKGSDEKQILGHYIAYRYKIAFAGLWEEYDDLRNKCMTLQPTTAIHTNVTPSVIAYIKLNT